MLEDLHPNQRHVVIVREYDVPREFAFAAFTQPEHLVHWWSPDGWATPFAQMDLRVGGRFEIHMQSPTGDIYPATGTVVEVVPPERLLLRSKAYEDADGNAPLIILNTITFDDLGGKTRLTMRADVEHFEAHAIEALNGMREGWNQTLDKLGQHLMRQKLAD